MAKNKRKGEKSIRGKSAANLGKLPDFAKSRMVMRQVSVLGKLTDWQRKSAETEWVIGEYLE